MEIFPLSPASKAGVLHIIDKNTVLLGVEKSHEIGIIGVMKVEVIRGSFEIFGYQLSQKTPSYRICSTREHALKVISLPFKNKQEKAEVASFLSSSNLSPDIKDVITNKIPSNNNLLMLTSIEEGLNFMRYLENYIEFPLFSNTEVNTSSHISYLSTSVPKYNIVNSNKEWSKILESISSKSNPKTILCGGKGVGKSVLLRYLINKTLSSNSELLVLDFDPGQSEFTVMGCISAVLLTQPRLGPSFSNFINPIKSSYLGYIDTANKFDNYMCKVEKIIDFCRKSNSYGQIPWFINTMGFTEGIGMKIIKKIISLIQPTDVVQIKSKKQWNNFCNILTPELFINDSLILNYKLHFISSISETNKSTDFVTWGLNSMKKREIAVLSYFFPLIEFNSFHFLSCIPHRFDIDKIRLFISAGDKLFDLDVFSKLNCINGSMVALCCSENGDDLECLGFGIVRGVDYQTEELFVIAPIDELILNKVDVLYMTSTIQLPQSVYKKQLTCTASHVPYLAEQSSNYLSGMIRKSSARIRQYQHN